MKFGDAHRIQLVMKDFVNVAIDFQVTQKPEVSLLYQRLPASSMNVLYGANLRKTAFDLRFALREATQGRNYPVTQDNLLCLTQKSFRTRRYSCFELKSSFSHCNMH